MFQNTNKLTSGEKSKQALPQKQQGGCQETQNTAF